jgi:hypothetical protein
VRPCIILSLLFAGSLADAEEIVVRKGWLPFGIAGIEQELTFHPSEREYNLVRDQTIAKLKNGEAVVNFADGPWVRIETTATVGFEIEGLGSSSGATSIRQITAVEDALYRFEADS